MRGAGHARRAGDDPHCRLPLVRIARSGRKDRGDVGRLTNAGARPRLTSRPMSTTSISPASSRPAPSSKPGFNAANVTVRSAASTRVRASPVSPSTPLGMSTASTGASVSGVGRVVLASEAGAVGGVDHEISGRQRAAGASAASTSATRTPRRRSRRAASRPSLPLLPLPATHHDAAAVGAAEHVDRGAGERSPGPSDQHLDRLGRGGIDRGHLRRRHDGDHVPSMMPGCRHERPRLDQLRSPRSRVRREPGWAPTRRDLRGAIAPHLRPGAVLEIGVGTGAVALPLVEAGHAVVGVDLSPKMLAIAHGRLGARIALGDVMALPIATASVTNIVAVWVFQLVASVEQTMTEARRAIADEGRFLVVPSKAIHQPDEIDEVSVDFNAVLRGFRPDDTARLVALGEAAGFRLLAASHDAAPELGRVARRDHPAHRAPQLRHPARPRRRRLAACRRARDRRVASPARPDTASHATRAARSPRVRSSLTTARSRSPAPCAPCASATASTR